MAHIVCSCGHFFHPKRNGVLVEEGMPSGSRLGPSPLSPEGWGPYKLWYGDELYCRHCGTTIFAGFAQQPLSEHYRPEYERLRESHGPVRIFVEDCP